MNYLGPILALGVLIIVHEAGHFFVARWCGMRGRAVLDRLRPGDRSSGGLEEAARSSSSRPCRSAASSRSRA
jgi:hypothetical protein